MLVAHKDKYAWDIAQTYKIQTALPVVIAVRGYNYNGPGGIVGSFSDGSVTDSSWKCTRSVDDDWYMTNFNDSSWPNAYITNLTTFTWQKYPFNGISKSAQWIWSGSFTDEYVTVYCRKKIGTIMIFNYILISNKS